MTVTKEPMSPSQAFAFFQPLEFFSGLHPQILRDVAKYCTQVLVPAGQILFEQGEPPDCIYIVCTGRLGILIQQDNAEETESIYEAGSGEIVGEMGLLTGDPRSATVRSLRDSLLFRLSKDRFDELLDTHPALTRKIACSLSERLKHSNTRSFRKSYRVKTFAVIPAGEVAPVSQFTERLYRALSAIGPTRRITKAAVEEAVGSADMTAGRVVNWLNEEESKFAFLIYEADLHPSHWTARCIRQADRLLAVAQFDADKRLNEIELELSPIGSESSTAVASLCHPRIDLILVHRHESFRPVGTPEWLSTRSVYKHHHICKDSSRDFQDLAKVLTGKAIGLVLGGGGARGFAHIGAIQAIEEAGLTIETIGGTSQGALIAAQYAMGINHKDMITTNRNLFRDFRPFKGDKTIPIFSFLSGVTSNKGLQSLFGETYISDLKIPFFCVSANLSLAKLVVHHHSPVWKAVRCSMSLPVLMSPVIENGHLIVDGGVLNNLPVDIMRQHCNGPIVAIDVSPPVDLLADCEDRDSLGFLGFIRRKVLRGKGSGSIPHLFEILMRTAFLSSIHHRETMSKHADLLVHPPMAGVSLLDWGSLETLAEIGYQTTRERLKYWDQSTALARVTLPVEEFRSDVQGGFALEAIARE